MASVPLQRSPLRLVVAQLRFPRVIALTDESYVGQLQELIRGTYSDLRKDAENQVILGPQGVQAQQSSEVWRFTDAKTGWEVSLAQEFVALSIHSYTSRDDFMVRLRAVLEAVQQVAQLRTAERFGVRYIDRISSEPLGRIGELVRPEVLGPVSPHGAHGADLQHSLTDCQYALEGSRALRARWGLLPANSTFDPAVEPDSEVTYVSGSIRPPDERLERLRVLDETARWAVDEYGVRAGELLRGRHVEVPPLTLIAQGEADVRQTVADAAARIEPGPGYAVRSRDRGSPRSMTETQRARLARASVKPIRSGVVRDPSVYEQDLGEAIKGVPEPQGPRRTRL